MELDVPPAQINLINNECIIDTSVGLVGAVVRNRYGGEKGEDRVTTGIAHSRAYLGLADGVSYLDFSGVAADCALTQFKAFASDPNLSFSEERRG